MKFWSVCSGFPDPWNRCLDWILDCQTKTVHPFTGAQPGGWGWTNLPGAVPDADDTPGALLALHHLLVTGRFENRRHEITCAAENGIVWLLKLQNRDRGWPTFCKGWGRLPFDRSGADLTAHAIRALLAWRSPLQNLTGRKKLIQNMDRAVVTGFQYLKKQQEPDGSWIPLWFGNQDRPDEENPFYGTAKVSAAYRDARRIQFELESGRAIDTQPERFGLNWLVKHQNTDGGWGGGKSISWADNSLGHSSVEETSLCCEALMESDIEEHRNSARRGLQWLVQACQNDCIQCSSPIGFYFAKLWYFEKSYPLIFSTAAILKAKSRKTVTR